MSARSVPVLRTWSSGEVDTGAFMQSNVKIPGDFLLNRPMVALRETAAITMTTAATFYSVTFTQEDEDTDGFHESVTHPAWITVPTGLHGWYDVTGGFSVSLVSGNNIIAAFAINGVQVPETYHVVWAGGTGNTSAIIASSLYLNDGDHLEMWAQCSVAGKALAVTSGQQPYLKARWAGLT